MTCEVVPGMSMKSVIYTFKLKLSNKYTNISKTYLILMKQSVFFYVLSLDVERKNETLKWKSFYLREQFGEVSDGNIGWSRRYDC